MWALSDRIQLDVDCSFIQSENLNAFINVNDAKNLFVDNVVNIDKKLLTKMVFGPKMSIGYATFVNKILSKSIKLLLKYFFILIKEWYAMEQRHKNV